MAIRKVSNRLARISAYSHVEDHLREKTVYGGILSLVGGLIALWLVVSEAVRCLSYGVREDMSVDLSREETMHIRFNVTFPALPCRSLRVTTGDLSGNFETEGLLKSAHDGEVHKWRLDPNGKRLERQEYLAPRGSDNPFVLYLDYEDMNEMRNEIVGHYGCNIHGWMDVKRIGGNLAFLVRQEAILASQDDIGTMEALLSRHMHHGLEKDHPHAVLLNASHIIHMLRFGPSYSGQIRPLENTRRIDRKATGIDKYFVKVVPVTHKSFWGRETHSEDYSVTEYYQSITLGQNALPGFIVMYDLWPIRVTKSVSRLGLLHFMVRACAVGGGIWTVTNITNRLVHSTLKSLGPNKRKHKL
ncbi:hypothetical protein M9434_003487 [Picochlorum sp. BPE23]|nr:hypothetical protein M9434_003487 [Picochlorum sp. BPE23]